MTLSANPHLRPRRYDAWNHEHQDWLMWWLDGYAVRFDELDEVGFRLHGRTTDDFDKVILQVKSERRPPDDPEEFLPDFLKRRRPRPAAAPAGPRKPASLRSDLAADRRAALDARKRQLVSKPAARAPGAAPWE